jgi:rfaE bifunctional protein nucleotidyltransferase chain/domain
MIYTKLIDKKSLKTKLDFLKKQNKKIVFTNGCFDLLHRGHVCYLKKAKKLGDILVVALNSDNSIHKIKGKSRPILNENERAEILSALKSIDFVYIFDEETPFEIIDYIKPNILVKGGDYNLDNIVGKDILENYGGKVITIPFVKNKSTTNSIDNILKRYNEKK